MAAIEERTATGERPRLAVGSREFVAVVATCMGMAALSIDLMLPAFSEMRAEFGLPADSTSVSWVLTAFFLGLALGQVVYGPLSDRFGRKPMLYAGLAVYAASATAAALAPTLGSVVALRVLWGFGAAAPRSLALAMVRDTHEGDRMARTMSMVMATFIVVPVVAPSLGAALLAVGPWRLVFWAPVAVAAALALWTLRLPETLAPEDRRSVRPAALLEAARVVVRNRQTVAFGLAVTCLFGVMTAYLGSSEIVVDEVFGQADLFPVLFGALALTLGVGALLNARLVMRLGLARVLRGGAVHVVAVAAALAVLATATGGHPPLWAFGLLLAALLPGVAVLLPNCNTAAMAPVPHVAGMAAALLGTVSTGGGALLGSLVDAAYDGSITPFAYATLLYTAVTSVSILVLARRGAAVVAPAS